VQIIESDRVIFFLKLNIPNTFLYLIVLLVTFFVDVHAESNETLKNLSKERNKTSEDIKKVESNRYPYKIVEIDRKMSKLIEEQDKICRGEFFVKIKGDDEVLLKKLTKEESIVCLEEIKIWKINITRYLFRLRRIFLDDQLKEMNKKLVFIEEMEIKRKFWKKN